MNQPDGIRSPVTCAWAGRALDGHSSGDLQVVEAFSERALVALIDGLGHGPEAALAARVAAAIISEQAQLPIAELVHACHEGLRRTRGVVMTLTLFDAESSTLSFCGVGNVEGTLFHTDPQAPLASEAISARGGVVGYRLPPLKVGAARVWPGDLLVLASDGVRSGFGSNVRLEADPQSIANELLAEYGKETDDALVLVARYRGRSA